MDSRALPDPLEVGEAINYEVRDGIVYDLDFANLLDEVADDYGVRFSRSITIIYGPKILKILIF